MHPYELIVSRDDSAFPFDDFSTYPRLMLVDWKEEESRILNSFFKATELPGGDTRLVMNETTGNFHLVHGDLNIEVPWSEEVSAQNSMLQALQKVFGSTHSIRYLNHAAFGDTGYFSVETHEMWKTLERQNPHVRWFFTPIELLPDIFHADFKILSQIGQNYASVS